MQCLAYAVQKYKAITGKSSPSTAADDQVGTWYDNANTKTNNIQAYSVACWRDYIGLPEGHAIFVAELVPGLNKYHCYEANWDLKGNTREIYRNATELGNMYNYKYWQGSVYN